jgi:hypothetical protein
MSQLCLPDGRSEISTHVCWSPRATKGGPGHQNHLGKHCKNSVSNVPTDHAWLIIGSELSSMFYSYVSLDGIGEIYPHTHAGLKGTKEGPEKHYHLGKHCKHSVTPVYNRSRTRGNIRRSLSIRFVPCFTDGIV